MDTASDIYERKIKALPAGVRLRIATLILNELAPESMIDYDDAWSDQDLKDVSAASWRRAYPDEPNDQ